MARNEKHNLRIPDFSGRWLTSFGPMELTQAGRKVHGSYRMMNAECPVTGEIRNGRLWFRYQEPEVEGQGWFELTRRGRAFAGRFQPNGEEGWKPWEGERAGFDGLWNTSFGLLRLVEEGHQVRGYYMVGGGAALEGRRLGNRLVFRYREPKARGRGQFVLADDGLSFQGKWKAGGQEAEQPWLGVRVRPQPGLTWLVVLEAPWQRFLAEQEYAFGHMLREFFARLPHVQVRHRFFSNEAGLRQLLLDLAFIAEPVVLVLATHGGPEGAHVNGSSVPFSALVDGLRPAGDLRMVHFSACLMMQDPAMMAHLQEFSDASRTSFSGYKTRVNWAASAILEFALLELVLHHGMGPSEAASQVTRLLPFASDKGVEGGAFPAAGFHMVVPRRGREGRGKAARLKRPSTKKRSGKS